jgi:hypothetical protein
MLVPRAVLADQSSRERITLRIGESLSPAFALEPHHPVDLRDEHRDREDLRGHAPIRVMKMRLRRGSICISAVGFGAWSQRTLGIRNRNTRRGSSRSRRSSCPPSSLRPCLEGRTDAGTPSQTGSVRTSSKSREGASATSKAMRFRGPRIERSGLVRNETAAGREQDLADVKALEPRPRMDVPAPFRFQPRSKVSFDMR